jgi:hypothetical protein
MTEVLVSTATMRLLDDPKGNRERVLERTITAIAANPGHWVPLAARAWYGPRELHDLTDSDRQDLGKHRQAVTWIEADNASKLKALCWALLDLFELDAGHQLRETGVPLLTGIVRQAWPGVEIDNMPERHLLARWCRVQTRLYQALPRSLRDVGGATDSDAPKSAQPQRIGNVIPIREAL